MSIFFICLPPDEMILQSTIIPEKKIAQNPAISRQFHRALPAQTAAQSGRSCCQPKAASDFSLCSHPCPKQKRDDSFIIP
jgi:hypothetical protein